MAFPDDVAEDENLGRSVSSETSAKRGRRSQVRYFEFMPPEGETKLSVDRLNLEDTLQGPAKIAWDRCAANGREFYGWAVVTAADARDNGRAVVYSPQEDNPFHTDIVFPSPDKEDQRDHAQDLRDRSSWCERPG